MDEATWKRKQYALFSELIEDDLNSLIKSGFVREVDGRLSLTQHGKEFSWIMGGLSTEEFLRIVETEKR